MDGTIESIEYAVLPGRRPRHAGSNARLGPHGADVNVPVVRLRTADGAAGFGLSRLDRVDAEALVGRSVDDIFTVAGGTAREWRALDLPLWDLAGVRAGRSVHQLLAGDAGKAGTTGEVTVRCYDTSLYFDDLAARTDAEGAAIIAGEALEGVRRGHAAFKVKVGRGARWMPGEDGLRRDIAVVRQVREAVGPGIPLMVDANNGWNLELTKRFLTETADIGIFWVEESFHEDAVLYADLHTWIADQGLSTLIADGEGDASPRLLDMARSGIVDVVQYDIIAHTVTGWRDTGRRLDTWGRRTAPHGYGTHLGNMVSGHLAGAIDGFAFVEWDHVDTPGLETSAYRLDGGVLTLPSVPGFGVRLDEDVYTAAVADTGWTVG